MLYSESSFKSQKTLPPTFASLSDVKLSSPLSPETNSTKVSERTCFTPESSDSSERVQSPGKMEAIVDPSESVGSSSTVPRPSSEWAIMDIPSKTSPDPSVRLMTANADSKVENERFVDDWSYDGESVALSVSVTPSLLVTESMLIIQSPRGR